MRLYEPLGARSRLRVIAGFESSGAEVVDLLERPLESDDWDGSEISLRPFQIVTLRFTR